MTERPMWDPGRGDGEHPDEGTIHAWLDDALDAASAERVAAHVRGCATCAAAVAEARGLIAGASRIVSALDAVPAGSRPAWAQGAVQEVSTAPAPQGGNAGESRSLWRRLRVTPTRAAIAATLLVALGVTLTHDRIAMDSVQSGPTLAARHADRSDVGGAGVAASPVTPAAPAPATATSKDAMLDSAVARNLAIAQGRPRIEAAREPAIPQAPPPSAGVQADAPAALSEQRVAAGRAATEAGRDTVGVAPDKLRVRGDIAGSVSSVATGAPVPARRKASEEIYPRAVAKMSQAYADAGARACYLLTSPQSGAMWGDQPLPLTVVVDSGPAVGTRSAMVRSGASGAAMRAVWTRAPNDSVAITLQRVGLTGSIALGPDAPGRAGTAMSGPIAEGTGASRMRQSDPVADARATVGSRSALRVSLRPVDCPSR